MNIIANGAFHAINKAVQTAQEPSIEEILAELTADLEDAEARLYCAQMHSDQHKWMTERDRWQRRITALRRHIKALEGSF
jgi:hypothetical protein